MNVLLQGRSHRSVASTPGGDQVLIEETAAALQGHVGVGAEISSDLEPDLEGYDLVHLFGLVRPQEVWLQARNAARQGKPIVLSTVYCDVWDFERLARTGPVGWIARRSNRDVVEALKAAGRGLNSREWSRGSTMLFRRGFAAMQEEIVALTSVFLPNSHSEWRRVTKDLGLAVAKDRVFVAPNGVNPSEPEAFDPCEGTPPRLMGFRGCVASVARIEGRKNQLNLIEAIQGTEHQLVLAGQEAANQRRYVARVRSAAAAAGNVHLLGTVSEKEKWCLYNLAHVHALPSWMETTGLSSLEAGLKECALVVSPNGDTREYFGNDAEYCDPSRPASIRAAIGRAFSKGPSHSFVQRVTTEFTWDKAAEVTLAAYAKALELNALARKRGPDTRRTTGTLP